jgi:hypothetical protein
VESLFIRANPEAIGTVFPKTLVLLSCNLLTSKLFKNGKSGHSLEPSIIGMELVSAAKPGDWKICTQLVNNYYSFNKGKNDLEFYFKDAVNGKFFAVDATIYMLLNFRRIE